MGTTTNFALRYPAETDAPDGATQIQNLAEDVDAALESATATQFVLPIVARKATDEGRTSTTLANDTSLVLTGLLTSGIYEITAMIAYNGGAGGSEGDLQIGWAIPSGSTGRYARTNMTTGGTPVLGQADTAWSDTPAAGTNGVSTNLSLLVKGILIAGANGSLQFKWSKNTAPDGTQTHVLANSYLTARRVG